MIYMTNEEAVEILKGAIKKPNTEDGYMGQALNMGIKALEQQPCEDAISRDAVEKITWEEPSYDDALNVLTEVRDKVRALPSVNAIVISKGATNGDMISKLFPDFLFIPCEKHNLLQMLLYEDNETQKGLIECIEFDLDWWNSPYKAESRK